MLQASSIAPAEADQPAPFFAQRLQQAVDAYFVDDQVSIVVDDDFSSKASAGTTRIRIRGSAFFSELDFDQLYHHEALVHAAPAINGGRQTNLKNLSLSAPRTTRTNECGIWQSWQLSGRPLQPVRFPRGDAFSEQHGQ